MFQFCPPPALSIDRLGAKAQTGQGNSYSADYLFIRISFGFKDLTLKAFELSTNSGLTKFVVTCCESVE
jgi:hypothetical protein